MKERKREDQKVTEASGGPGSSRLERQEGRGQKDRGKGQKERDFCTGPACGPPLKLQSPGPLQTGREAGTQCKDKPGQWPGQKTTQVLHTAQILKSWS
jgi:hypothetical protein